MSKKHTFRFACVLCKINVTIFEKKNNENVFSCMLYQVIWYSNIKSLRYAIFSFNIYYSK